MQVISLSECLKLYTNQEKLGADDAWWVGCHWGGRGMSAIMVAMVMLVVAMVGASSSPRYCPNCQKHQQATKKFDLWSLPEVRRRLHHEHKYSLN